MGFLDSLFTAPGSNARNSQMDQIFHLMGDSQHAWDILMPYLLKHFGMTGQIGSALDNLAPSLLSSLSPTATQGRIDAYGHSADEQANKASRNYGLIAKSQGWGDGGTMGKTQGFLGKAARATGDYGAWEHSPQGKAANLASVLQGLGGIQGWGQNEFGNLMGLGAFINGQTPNPVGPGFGDYLGQALGMASSFYGGGKGGVKGLGQIRNTDLSNWGFR